MSPSTDVEPVARPGWRRHRVLLMTALATVLTVFLVAWVISTWFLRVFIIPSTSMEPTLHEGDRVAVSVQSDPDDLRRGDVVVFADTKAWLPTPQPHPVLTALRGLGVLPESGEAHLAKRVIGLPGDRISYTAGQAALRVNGTELDEPYLWDHEVAETSFDVVVPPGQLWVLGDHRAASADSRDHQDGPGGGFVSAHDVVGRAWAVVWPLERLGPVPQPETGDTRQSAPAGSRAP
ncbi:MAG: signal peptidase I [Micrococcus sp.]|nr:signal peptidase I [Micrococcus sp.]